MAEIKSISIRHNEIMDYLMSNPSVKLGDAAKFFGVTGPWLSTIIHSDAFQELLKAKQDMAFHSTVLPMREKMLAVAHQALDKLADMLPMETEVRTVNDVTEGMLDRLGFGAKPINGNNLTINQQNNFVVPNANAAEIAAAREMLQARKGPALGVQIDGHVSPISLPREGAALVGEVMPRAHIPFTPGENRERESGIEVRAASA